ncbi:MAG: MMPL family transporter [Pseudomonadota bacterium]|nr:MMPL family transporter [Pseudomonadota bacterium]
MGFGALWGLALASLTVGHLTLMTSAFLAILFGLGADYGIFTSSRITEERRAGKPLVEAIAIGIGSSFRAVLTAGGASLAIFSALGTVDFPGFAQLGVVAAGGVLMILISTWMVQPALYALLPPKRATGFPTTHHVFSKAIVEGFIHGTLLAVVVCLIWLILMLRSLTGFVLASLPLLIGGGWMLGAMSLFGLDYNYANIIALPLVIALAVDYGVWFSHR